MSITCLHTFKPTSTLWVQSMKCWHVKSGLQGAGWHFWTCPCVQFNRDRSTTVWPKMSQRQASWELFHRARISSLSCHSHNSVMIKSRKVAWCFVNFVNKSLCQGDKYPAHLQINKRTWSYQTFHHWLQLRLLLRCGSKLQSKLVNESKVYFKTCQCVSLVL